VSAKMRAFTTGRTGGRAHITSESPPHETYWCVKQQGDQPFKLEYPQTIF